MNRAYLSVLAIVLLVGCASPIERRVSRNPEMFNRLSSADQSSVRRGELREGMTKDAVFLTLGRPARVHQGVRSGKALERWSYNSFEPVYRHQVGFGGYWGAGCGPLHDPFFWGGPSVDYVPVEGTQVEFVGDRVVGYTVRR
jgi:hypothetical protein